MVAAMDNDRTLDGHLLRTFASVVAERSVTRGAARLGISQPTASGHIKRLEEQLDSNLFDRSAPGIRLTDTGELLLRHAREVLRLNDELFELIAAARASDGRMRVGIPIEIRWNLLAALSEFSALHPDLHLELQRDKSAALAARFRAGELDVCALVNDASLTDAPAYRWSETLFWAATPAQPLPPTEPVPLVVPPRDCACATLMLAAFERSGIPYRVVANAPDVETAIDIAKDGKGFIALLTSNITRPLRVLPADCGLPPLPGRYQWSIHVNATRSTAVIERLAHIIAYLIAPSSVRIESVQHEPAGQRRAASGG
jgi:DNA-binding transcriptional LysR family regulator